MDFMCHMCVGHMNLIFKAKICLRTRLMKAMKCDGYPCMVLGTDIRSAGLQPAVFSLDLRGKLATLGQRVAFTMYARVQNLISR